MSEAELEELERKETEVQSSITPCFDRIVAFRYMNTNTFFFFWWEDEIQRPGSWKEGKVRHSWTTCTQEEEIQPTNPCDVCNLFFHTPIDCFCVF